MLVSHIVNTIGLTIKDVRDGGDGGGRWLTASMGMYGMKG